jgi:hypothetical protein
LEQETLITFSDPVESAKAANTPILFTPVELPVEVAEQIKSADAAVVTQLRRAPIMASKPTGEEVQLAEAVTPPPAKAEAEASAAAQVPAQTASPQEAAAAVPMLPATARPLPTIASFGLLAVGGANGRPNVRKAAL